MAERKSFSRDLLATKIKDAIPLQNHWETFIDWLLEKTELFAKKYRYTLTARIMNLAFDIQEKIIKARFNSEKLEILNCLSIDIEIMNSFMRRCYNKKLLSVKEIGRAHV